MKKTVIRTRVYNCFKFFAGRVTVDDLNRKYRAPDSCLLWDASIAKGEGFVAYTQR